jgi:monovalent cation:H+ antiporter-2, CPA2 family
MHIPLFNEILIVFVLSIAVIFVCHRLKIPVILGFLVTGVLCGPYGFKLVKAVREVEVLAEIGIITLLFTIGIEFSLKRFFEIKKIVLLGGSIQVLLTIFVVFMIGRGFEARFAQALFVGFLFSLSSTAIVLKILQERAEIDTPHGRTSMGILIYQDIIIVPMMLLVPILAGEMKHPGSSFFLFTFKTVGLIVFVYLSAKWLIPYLLYQISRTRSRELFLLAILLICFGFAWLTSSLSLSLALGAFLAGLIVSESEYGYQAIGNILPFRDIFTSFFFLSVGMLLNVDFFLQNPILIISITLGIMFLKTITGGFSTIVLGLPLRTAILAGLALSQVGEFSFILSKTGMSFGLINRDIYQLFLAVSLLSMASTPFIMNFAPSVADFLLKFPLPRKLKTGLSPLKEVKKEIKEDHLIIVGFGVNGKNLARAAKVAGIPYLIVEMNPETVRDEKTKGEPIYYGDATHEAVLQHANIEHARVAMIAISDPAATRRIVNLVRQLNPKICIIVRTRYLKEMKDLYALGADEVIPEEFETSIEIFTRVLRKYLVPRDDTEKLIAEIRAEGYEMLRKPSWTPVSFSELRLDLPEVEVDSLKVGEQSPLLGQTLLQIDLRKRFGITLLAVRRAAKVFSNPGNDMRIWANDVLIVFGTPEKIRGFIPLLGGSKAEEDGRS